MPRTRFPSLRPSLHLLRDIARTSPIYLTLVLLVVAVIGFRYGFAVVGPALLGGGR